MADGDFLWGLAIGLVAGYFIYTATGRQTAKRGAHAGARIARKGIERGVHELEKRSR